MQFPRSACNIKLLSSIFIAYHSIVILWCRFGSPVVPGSCPIEIFGREQFPPSHSPFDKIINTFQFEIFDFQLTIFLNGVKSLILEQEIYRYLYRHG